LARKQLPSHGSDRRQSPGYRAPAGLNFTGCWTVLGRRGLDEAGDTISTDQAPRRTICSLSRSADGDWKTGRGRASTTSALRDRLGAGWRDNRTRAICNVESKRWASPCGPSTLLLLLLKHPCRSSLNRNDGRRPPNYAVKHLQPRPVQDQKPERSPLLPRSPNTATHVKSAKHVQL